MKKILFLLALLSLLASCSPQKRLERLVKNHPELITTDTIHDTTIVPGWQYDTIVQLNTDTVTIEKNGTTIVLYKTLYDSIMVEIEAEPDTIYKEIPCPQVVVEEENTDWYKNKWVWVLLIFVIVLFIINKLFK